MTCKSAGASTHLAVGKDVKGADSNRPVVVDPHADLLQRVAGSHNEGDPWPICPWLLPHPRLAAHALRYLPPGCDSDPAACNGGCADRRCSGCRRLLFCTDLQLGLLHRHKVALTAGTARAEEPAWCDGSWYGSRQAAAATGGGSEQQRLATSLASPLPNSRSARHDQLHAFYRRAGADLTAEQREGRQRKGEGHRSVARPQHARAGPHFAVGGAPRWPHLAAATRPKGRRSVSGALRQEIELKTGLREI